MKPIILASRSPTRGRLLAAAGISFSVDPADIDERSEIDALARAHSSPSVIALDLAAKKARLVAQRHPDAMVIAADQTLEIDRRTMLKPTSIEEATEQLRRLRGRGHYLHSAVTCINGESVWRHTSSARLVMRFFSDEFLDAYVATCGERTLESVGAYHLEGHGIQLFQEIDGDFFTILGLPLIPLLDHLRAEGLLLR